MSNLPLREGSSGDSVRCARLLGGADAELRASPVGAAGWALRDAVWQQPHCTGCRLAYQPGCQAIWWARHWQEPSHESPD